MKGPEDNEVKEVEVHEITPNIREEYNNDNCKPSD